MNQQPGKLTSAAIDTQTSGVEALIGRLRDEGISEGKQSAGKIVADAELQASQILADARAEAERIVARAAEDAGKLKAGGEDAVRLAMRDTILALEGDMLEQFAERLRRLVRGALTDPEFVQRLILELGAEASQAAKGAAHAELLLSSELVTLEDLQQKPEAAKPGTLMHFVLSMGGGILREGMSFGVAKDGEAGIRVKLADEDLQIDLTESAVSELLLRHMLPRYRALLRGFVKSPDAPPAPKSGAR